MKKLIISLLAISLSSFAGQMTFNYNGTPTVIQFTDIAGMEIEQNNMVLVQRTGAMSLFKMGQLYNAEPIHLVALSSFYIGKYEVTQAEWIATMETNPSSFTGDLNRPVENVSWYDILIYCNKRSVAEGLTPCYTINNSTDPVSWGTVPTTTNATWDAVICNWSANGYRIPTEAEWEFAARGGNCSNGYNYSGSNTIDDVGWYADNSGNTTHPVGTKLPNELGIYDMSGNVFEWTWDWYANYSSSTQTNPTGPTTGSERILRGGSYYYYFVVAWRERGGYPYSVNSNRGFRLARSTN